MLPGDSDLVAPRRIKLSFAETAELPLILPTGIHGLRRLISAEFERRNLTTRIVAEIDSLSLLMTCVREGMARRSSPCRPRCSKARCARTGARWRFQTPT